MPGAHFPIYRQEPVEAEEEEERDALLGLPRIRKRDGTAASRTVERVYPWLQLAGEERKAAVAERRTVLLTQILALDAPAGDQGYRAAKVEWDVLLQKGQDEPSWPGGKTPKHIVRANTLRKPSSSRVFQFFDYFFGAKHAVPQPTRIHSLLSGRVRSGTYHGRSGQPVGATASPRKPRASSLQPTRRRNNAPMP